MKTYLTPILCGLILASSAEAMATEVWIKTGYVANVDPHTAQNLIRQGWARPYTRPEVNAAPARQVIPNKPLQILYPSHPDHDRVNRSSGYPRMIRYHYDGSRVGKLCTRTMSHREAKRYRDRKALASGSHWRSGTPALR